MRILLLLLLLLPSLARSAVVDRIVAQVDDQLVLESDVGLEERLAAFDTSESLFWNPRHKDAMQRLVDAALIRLAAGDIDLYQPSDQAVKERRDAVQAKLGGADAWRDFLKRSGQDEQSFERVLRRRMVVERYLGRNNQVEETNPDKWLGACDSLVDQLRERSRVRLIELRGGK